MLRIQKTVRKNFRALHETIKESYSNENGLDSDDEDNFKEALQEHRKSDLEKRKLESQSWLFGPHKFQLKLITSYNYYFLLQQLLDSQFNIQYS